MKITFFLLVAAASALIGPLVAGTLEMQPKETAPPTVTESEPWQFTIAVPGWLSSVNGTIGVRGVNADIDVPVTEVLQHFDAILAGRFGIFGEVIYIGLSDGAQINGLINNIHETVDTTYVDGALSWRLVNQPRWSLDFAAGTHYTTVYEQLELHSDPILIQQTSEQFVTNISDDLEARLNNDISNKDFLATVGSTIESDIVSQIDKHNSLDRHQRNPRIPIGPLGGRVEEDIANVVHDFIVAKETALRIRIDALIHKATLVARQSPVQLTRPRPRSRISFPVFSTRSWAKRSRGKMTGSIPILGCAADTISTKRSTRPYAARSAGSVSALT